VSQRLLAGFDKELGVFYWGVLKDAVAQVEDMAGARQGGDGVLGGAADLVGWGEEDGGVDVALDGDLGA
jgi:hypothetical protein